MGEGAVPREVRGVESLNFHDGGGQRPIRNVGNEKVARPNGGEVLDKAANIRSSEPSRILRHRWIGECSLGLCLIVVGYANCSLYIIGAREQYMERVGVSRSDSIDVARHLRIYAERCAASVSICQSAAIGEVVTSAWRPAIKNWNGERA